MNLLGKGRLSLDNIDVKPYVVDNVTSLCEVTNGLGTYYYYQPNYGENVQEAILNEQ